MHENDMLAEIGLYKTMLNRLKIYIAIIDRVDKCFIKVEINFQQFSGSFNLVPVSNVRAIKDYTVHMRVLQAIRTIC